MNRRIISFAFLLVVLSSCRDSKSIPDVPTSDHVSKFFHEHRDSIYAEFVRLGEKELAPYRNQNLVYVSTNQPRNSYMGRLTAQIKKDSRELDVSYSYQNLSHPPITILISTNYNRRLVKAVDTIFNNVSSDDQFKIEKFIQPKVIDSNVSFVLDNFEVSVKDMKIKSVAANTLKDITVYIVRHPKEQLTESDIIRLRNSLFGEEYVLKKVNNLVFIVIDTVPKDLLTVYDYLMRE